MGKKNRLTDFSKSSFHLGSHWSEPVRRSLSEGDISLGTWSYTYFFFFGIGWWLTHIEADVVRSKKGLLSLALFKMKECMKDNPTKGFWWCGSLRRSCDCWSKSVTRPWGQGLQDVTERFPALCRADLFLIIIIEQSITAQGYLRSLILYLISSTNEQVLPPVFTLWIHWLTV